MSETALSVDKPEEKSDACPQCGMARRELYFNGQMGCARCYETFAVEVQRALKEIHGETRHLGKNAA
jgi:protein arginine kinase activator